MFGSICVTMYAFREEIAFYENCASRDARVRLCRRLLYAGARRCEWTGSSRQLFAQRRASPRIRPEMGHSGTCRRPRSDHWQNGHRSLYHCAAERSPPAGITRAVQSREKPGMHETAGTNKTGEQADARCRGSLKSDPWLRRNRSLRTVCREGKGDYRSGRTGKSALGPVERVA